MKKATLSVLFALLAIPAFCTVWVVTTPGFNFSPMNLTIQEGDSVMFNIGNIHTVLEVSEQTWNSNGNTPLAGGFSLGFGGGMLLPADLTPGEHYYVCQPHANMGMKGTITVEETTATEFDLYNPGIAIYPNPSPGNFQVFVNMPKQSDNYNIYVYNLDGNEVFASTQAAAESILDIDLGNLPKGIYVVRYHEKSGTYSRRLVLQ